MRKGKNLWKHSARKNTGQRRWSSFEKKLFDTNHEETTTVIDNDEKASRPVTLSDTFLIRVGVYESLNTYMTHRSRRQEFLVTNKTFLADL